MLHETKFVICFPKSNCNHQQTKILPPVLYSVIFIGEKQTISMYHACRTVHFLFCGIYEEQLQTPGMQARAIQFSNPSFTVQKCNSPRTEYYIFIRRQFWDKMVISNTHNSNIIIND